MDVIAKTSSAESVGQVEFIDDSEMICYETAISESTCYEYMVVSCVKEFWFVLVLYDNHN